MVVQFRDGGFPQECFLCGKLALGLKGEDRYVSPFEALEGWPQGACHLLCLRDEPSRDDIVGAADEYVTWRWPLRVEDAAAGWRVHVSLQAARLHLFKTDGWSVSIDASALDTAVQGDGERIFTVTSIVGYEEGPQEEVALGEFLDGLGTADRLIRPDLVRPGRLRRGKDITEATYSFALDDSMCEAAQELLPQITSHRRRAKRK